MLTDLKEISVINMFKRFSFPAEMPKPEGKTS
jgi:hypothetical protein